MKKMHFCLLIIVLLGLTACSSIPDQSVTTESEDYHHSETKTVSSANVTEGSVNKRDFSGEGMFAYLPDFIKEPDVPMKDCGDGAFMKIYSGVSISDAEKYMDDVCASGFFQISRRTENENMFVIAHDGEVLVNMIYTPYKSTMRILVEPCSDVAFLEKSKSSEGNSNTVVSITQIGMDYSGEKGKYQSGLSYVCRLCDGSFVVVDGGYYRLTDAMRMYENMKAQSNDKDIVISAWILTHAHSDHIGEFIKFAEFYSTLVKVEKIICNFPSDEDCKVTGDPERLDECRTAMAKYPDAILIKAHPGYVIPVAGGELEILYTTELYWPDILDQFNISSLVFRLRLGAKTILFLGDMLMESNRIISYVWGNSLKSDIVQVAHHGAKGGSTDIYKLISPSYAFWPVGAEDYQNYKDLPRNIFISTSPDIKKVWVARGDIITVLPDELD